MLRTMEPMERVEKKIINRGETTLESTSKLLRFLYIGNDENVFVSQRCAPISVDNLDTRLSFINDMAALRFSLPFGIIRKVMASNTLRRNDEALLAISYCLRRVNNIPTADISKLQTEIYKDLPNLLKTDSDFFLFVHLSNKILSEGQVKTGFGRGMKKALYQWYDQKTALELANIFGRNRGMNGWTHKDIIHMCHLKFDPVAQPDKAKIIETLFKRGSEMINDIIAQTNDPETLPEAVNRIFQICKFKINESAEDAAEIIRLNDFELGHLPAHLISQPKVWEILLPKLTYREVMRIFPMLHSLNLLKQNEVLSKNMSLALGNKKLISSSVVHPLEILAICRSYEQNARYNETVKKIWYQKKKVAKLNLKPDHRIVKRLEIGLNYSMRVCPQTGCDYFVTLDLREMAKKQTVLRMGQITCLEAMVLFALTLKKREKNTKIYTFVDNKTNLLPVKLTADMTFEKALDHCRAMLIKRTRQSLSLPLNYVDRNSKNTVFITIVDSVARFCLQREAPIDEFRLHRKTNARSKFIVLNLRRSSGDLSFSYEKGFLEICGLVPDTWKIINAFATNSFA